MAAAASERSSTAAAEAAAAAQQQQHQPTNSSAGTGQMTRASSDLQFSLAVASTCHEDGLQSAADDQYEPVLELQRIQACLQLSPEEAKLAEAVEEAKAANVRSAGCVDLRVVGSILRSRHGYLVCVRRANASRRPKAYLRQLRHDYLVVRGLAGDGSAAADSVLVDLQFRERFAIAHATPWYTKLLAALPADWVGPAAGLVPLVGLMAAGMRLCFKSAGVPLPPWREGRAMLSMWVPEAHDDEALPLLLAPDAKLVRLLAPFHSPFRTAVREATAAPGGSDAGTASGGQAAPGMQQQQPQHPADAYSSSSRRLPPLPRPASARVAQPGHITHHAHVTAPDVPRKIIMGFPVPSLPGVSDQQLSSTAGLSQDAPVARSGGSSEARGGGSSMQQPRQQQGSGFAAAAGSSSVEFMTRAAAGGAPHTAAHLAEHEQQQPQQQQQQQQGTGQPQPQAQQRRPLPAFASTSGVVVATAGGASPGIVINKKWLEQQLSGPSSPSALSATLEHAPGMAAASAAVAAAAPSAAAAGSPTGATKKPAAAAAGQFKSLEQLLPRMRTVRLGAA